MTSVLALSVDVLLVMTLALVVVGVESEAVLLLARLPLKKPFSLSMLVGYCYLKPVYLFTNKAYVIDTSL